MQEVQLKKAAVKYSWVNDCYWFVRVLMSTGTRDMSTLTNQ